MQDILQEILTTSQRELAARSQSVSLSELQARDAYTAVRPSFAAAIRSGSGIVAEHKRASPSAGVINDRHDLPSVIRMYEQAGASCISILTNAPYFQGSQQDLINASQLTNLPLLCKDFIHDAYQVHEARACGASAVLLIAAMLAPGELLQLAAMAHEIGLEVLVEIHALEEYTALASHPNYQEDLVSVIGVNNRDLKRMETSVSLSRKLYEQLPQDKVKISESGLRDAATLQDLLKLGYDGFLIGEYFMEQDDPEAACRELSGLKTRA